MEHGSRWTWETGVPGGDKAEQRNARFSRGLVLNLLIFVLLVAIPSSAFAGKTPASSPDPPYRNSLARLASSELIRDLLDKEQFQEALTAATAALDAARAAGDSAGWTRGLVLCTLLQTGLHRHEAALRFLRETPWPEEARSRATLELVAAETLVGYYRAYSWEINQRETVDSPRPLDLKSWTREDLAREALRSYRAVWALRDALGAEPVTDLGGILSPNTYPRGVRPTLRDAVTYLFAAFLADTSLWRPSEDHDLFRLDLSALLGETPGGATEATLSDPSAHPLVKIAAVLSDLETWHAGQAEREAALEARLERVRRLAASFTSPEDRKILLQDLRQRLPAFRDLPWWSMGQAELADLVREDDADPEVLIKARALALAGHEAFPDSPGGGRCLHIAKTIESPEYQMTGMAADGPGKRSIQVTHKNLAALHFRAYPLDLLSQVEGARDYNLLPAHKEVEKLLHGASPMARWREALPATPDFRLHRTFVTPPLTEPGLYVIVASAREDFAEQENRILGVNLIITNLTLVTQPEGDGRTAVTVLRGETGDPVAAAEVLLYRQDWQKGHQLLDTRQTDGAGQTFFPSPAPPAHTFFLAKKGNDLILDEARAAFRPRETTATRSASLIFTDRSVYRPGHQLFWKILAYEADGEGADLRVKPAAKLSVSLYDAQGQVVEARDAFTNEFGTVSGKFTIPAGRPLGAWRVGCSLPGKAQIRVEEYKRPTFEVSLFDPGAGLRLNQEAKLSGQARYYFGLLVTAGEVRWRVRREPVYPRWWEGNGGGKAGGQLLASGTSRLGGDGSFLFAFTPLVDEREAARSRDITYRFVAEAEVTDEGGETRSASRSFRLGFVAVEGKMEMEPGFFRQGEAAAVVVRRLDLNGVPRPGEGVWRLFALAQPEKARLPADMPESGSGAEGATAFRTPGDGLRPRWAALPAPSATMRDWANGPELASGSLTHRENGQERLLLPALPPGAYRLRYATLDDFDALCEASLEFVVAADAPSSLALPLLLLPESREVRVGGVARFLAHSGLPGQPLLLEIYKGGKLAERRPLAAGDSPAVLEIPVGEADRGGFGVRLLAVRDYQFMSSTAAVTVPWDNKELAVDFASFRDHLTPGGRERWTVTVRPASGGSTPVAAAELLATMYDRSLDLFAPYQPPSPISLFPVRTGVPRMGVNLAARYPGYHLEQDFIRIPGLPMLSEDRLWSFDGYGIGGPGRRTGLLKGAVLAEGMAADALLRPAPAPALAPAPAPEPAPEAKTAATVPAGETAGTATPLRRDFSETALWEPHLLTGPDGVASIEFTVPDSVTSWNVWVHAMTRDFGSGAVNRIAHSVKDLMVRPYLPRFLREGDTAEVRVMVNNAGKEEARGAATFSILDPATGESLTEAFGLSPSQASQAFTVPAGRSASLSFPVKAPPLLGPVAVRVEARAGDTADGELRPLPVLPGRMHLAQSRFVALRDQERRTMSFPDMRDSRDATLAHDQLVVTLDAQLFNSVLAALPYLVNYPYECTEQTLNRFLSTGILTSLFARYPAVARLAAELARRETRLETWDQADPNRKMALEETPWLEAARGGGEAGGELARVLDPRVAGLTREAALAKLKKAQTASGGWPWWPGGPPSPYMTLYLLHGFAKGLEFDVEAPREEVRRAWGYLHEHFLDTLAREMVERDTDWEMVSFLNYVLSAFPDDSWTGGLFTADERARMLEFSLKHRRDHSPLLKCYLALTLKRMGRLQEGAEVFAAVMDSAQTTGDEGTHWAAEDRAWLWYNDTIETHAFALRTLMELLPADARRHGLVHWLFLNKKVSHWKSTRATAEVVYALAGYLAAEGALGVPEAVSVTAGGRKTDFVFAPDGFSGEKPRVVIPGAAIEPATGSEVVVEKRSKGLLFASAVWRYSTEKLPEAGSGDFLSVERRFFRREHRGEEVVLSPLEEGTTLRAGDQVEVQLSIRAKHPMEYVHLNDPRAAGLEPENAVSRFRQDGMLGWYEEIRDSGANFFFEHLPQGEYTFRHRLRAAMSGVFRTGPATLSSMYAPEFSAHSAGHILQVAEAVEENEGKGAK